MSPRRHLELYQEYPEPDEAAQHPAADANRDARGFAIKLMGIDGESLLSQEGHANTQDFLLLSRPTFFNRDTKEFFAFIKAFNAGRLRLLLFFLTHPAVFFTGLGAAKHYGNLLETQFWSTTPYRLGELAVKYSAKPRSPRRSPVPRHPDPNYLRTAAAELLAETEVLYDFYVQVQFRRDRNLAPQVVPAATPDFFVD